MKRLSDKKIQDLFSEIGAIQLGSHFVYTSGRHGPNYVAKDQIGLDPKLTDHLAYELAFRLKESGLLIKNDGVVAVVGAPMGAIRLSDRVCYWLNVLFPRVDGIKLKSIYAEKREDGELSIKRGFPKIFREGNGNGIVCVEDILNTGKSALSLVSAVKTAGGNPVAIGALCNRGDSTAESLGVPNLVSLMNVKFDTFPEDGLPEWLTAIPVRTDLGHGAHWLETQAQK